MGNNSEDKPVRIIIKYRADGLMRTEYTEVPYKVAKYVVSLMNKNLELEKELMELKGQ